MWGYEDLLGVLADPSHPEYDALVAWPGGSFDPERFDRKEFDENLRNVRAASFEDPL